MHFRNLFYWSYWFNQPYIAHGTLLVTWLVIFLALIFLGIVALFVQRQRTDNAEQRFLKRFSSCVITMGLFGLAWLLFRQERIPLLALRFWLLLWLAIFIPWMGKIVWYAVRRLPQIRAEHAAKAAREKYLPGR